MFTELIFIIFIFKKIYKNSLVSWIWSKGHPRSYNCYLVFMGFLQELNYWSFNNDYTNDILEYKTWNNINQTKLNLKIHYIESLLYKEVSIPPSCYNIILQLKTNKKKPSTLVHFLPEVKEILMGKLPYVLYVWFYQMRTIFPAIFFIEIKLDWRDYLIIKL